MNKLMAFLQGKLAFLPMLGAGKRWVVNIGGKPVTIFLWPFVALAICVAIMVVIDWVFA